MPHLYLVLAAAGHILCGICDCLLTYTPNGRFRAADLADNVKMAALFDGTPLRRPVISTLLGCLALAMCFAGYAALAEYLLPGLCGGIMAISAILFFIFGTAHHVICGAIEWFYIKLGRTEEALDAITEFFKKTSLTMIVCYLGTAAYCVTLCAAIISRSAGLPLWACAINTIPIFLVLSLLKLPGAGNWAGALMCGGLGVLFAIYA